MKKIILVLVASMAFAVAAFAQPKAVGIKLGWFNGISYQHYLNDPNFMQFDLAVSAHSNAYATTAVVNLGGSYNFNIANPQFTTKGTWGIYAGPALGISMAHTSYKDILGGALENNTSFSYGIGAQAGIEYTFWFPLQLSLDVQPLIAFGNGGFSTSSLVGGLIPSLSVRYAF